MPLPKQYILGCSKNLPTILVISMFEVFFRTPGRRQHIPRMFSLILTPASEASESLFIMSMSVKEFIFMNIFPALPLDISPSISASILFLRLFGETSKCSYSPCRLDIDIFWKNKQASSPIDRLAVMSDKSVYIFAVCSL